MRSRCSSASRVHPGASVAGVARETGLPRATVTRVLATLADVGAARRDGGGWTLGPSIAALARGVDPPLAERAGPASRGARRRAGRDGDARGARGCRGRAGGRRGGGTADGGRGVVAGPDIDRPGVGLRPDAVGGARPAGAAASGGRAATGRAHRIDDPVPAGASGRARPDRAGRSRRGGRRVRAGPGRVGRPPSPAATGSSACSPSTSPPAGWTPRCAQRALAALRATAQSLTGASDTTTSSSSSHTR